MAQITDAEQEKLDSMYPDGQPEYLNIVDKSKIKIRAGQYEGAPVKWHTVTPRDVVVYYSADARNISSGIRTLGTFSTDWRMVDNMAKESLEIFKIINRPALNREAKKHEMSLK